VLLLSTLLGAAAGAALMTTDVGRQALVDQWERTALAFGQPVDDAAYARLEELSARSAVGYALVTSVISGPVLTVVIAGLLLAAFRRRPGPEGAAGRSVTFRQSLAVAAHAGFILALRQVIAAPVGYLRESTASATSLALWFPGLDEASPVARFFGAIDLFVVWWIVVLAIGTAVLFRRRTRSVAGAFVGIYVGLALLLALAMAISSRSV
jgi:hypothetical protein